MQCPYCKEDILEGALKCKHCGSMLGSPEAVPAPASDKSKIVAGILALLLGGFGIHKFYVGSWGWGIVYILLFWTWIPALLALVEAIRYFILPDDEFKKKAAALQGPFSFLW